MLGDTSLLVNLLPRPNCLVLILIFYDCIYFENSGGTSHHCCNINAVAGVQVQFQYGCSGITNMGVLILKDVLAKLFLFKIVIAYSCSETSHVVEALKMFS